MLQRRDAMFQEETSHHILRRRKRKPAEAGRVFETDILISRGLCVLRHTRKVDQHAALIAGDPGVVTGRLAVDGTGQQSP
jgi:hypothetical protein